MTPTQFKAARKQLGLSQSEIADILNVHPRTIRKWETDDDTRPPNPIACRVVLWMLDGYQPPKP